MAKEFEDYLIYFLLGGLFIVCMFSFGISIAGNYGYDSNIMTSDKFNYSTIENEINDSNSDSVGWLNSFKDDDPGFIESNFVLLSIWGFITNIIAVTKVIWQVISLGMFDVLGISPLLLGTISSIIFIMLIVSGWRKLRQG